MARKVPREAAPLVMIRQHVSALWHYRCPVCGITDEEAGYHTATDAIYCEVCVETDSRHVQLQRWPVEP
jgi:hypothetical protein